jgi:hypothetical protein
MFPRAPVWAFIKAMSEPDDEGCLCHSVKGASAPVFISHNVYFGRDMLQSSLEASRRDDLRSHGLVLLFLLESRLPWHIWAASVLSKVFRMTIK